MRTLGTSLLAAVLAVGFGVTAARAEITIAVAGPITGSLAQFGEQMKRGAEMAVKDINAKGGVLGQKLKLEVGDDACDPKQAVAVANQLASKKVVFVAGHFCSGSSIPASSVYHEEGILQISPASTNPKLTEQGFNNVFRTCGRDDQQGVVAGQYLVKHFKGKKIAIVHDKQAYSKGLADATKAELNKLGVKEAMYETINPGEKDYLALVTKLKSAGIDVIYYGGYHPELGLIVRQSSEQNYKPKFLSGDAIVTEEFWAIAGKAGEGVLMTFSPDPRKNPKAAPIVKEFTDSGYNPEAYTLYTYGTVQAWAEAATKAKSTDLKKVAAILHKDKFNTVLGTFGFDKKGDVTAPGYVVYVWKDGKYDYVKG